MEETIDYLYRPRIRRLLLGILTCSIGTAWAGTEALTNKRGMLVDHLFLFSPHATTLFFWVVTACCVVGCVLLSYFLLAALTQDRWLSLSGTDVVIPKPFSDGIITIPIKEIQHLAVQTVRTRRHQSRFLILTHQKGKATLNEAYFPQDRDFDDFIEILRDRLRPKRPTAPDRPSVTEGPYPIRTLFSPR